MSVLFADVFEAIRAIRVCKGTCEKDIMNFVQEKVGGCLSIKNVLKTIRTLNKLVEEGLLVKKGKRYHFPPNPPGGKNPCGDDEDDDESIEDDDDEHHSSDNNDNNDIDICNYTGSSKNNNNSSKNNDTSSKSNNSKNNNSSKNSNNSKNNYSSSTKSKKSKKSTKDESVCPQCPDDNDDDDDDDEDDDCDDDDGDDCDDDCDDECDEDMKKDDEENDTKQMERSLKGESSNTNSFKSKDPSCKEKSSSTNSKNFSKSNNTGNNTTSNNRSSNRSSNRSNNRSNSNNKTHGDLNNCDPKETESTKALSRCLSRTESDMRSKGNTRRGIKSHISKKREVDRFARIFIAKARGKELRNSLSKRSRLTNNYRSRSPIRRGKGDMYRALNLDKNGIMGLNPIQSKIFEEAVDAEMDVDVGVNVDYDIPRHPSSLSSKGNIPRPLGEKTGSCSSNFEKKILCETVKEEPILEAAYLAKNDCESKASLFKLRNPQKKFKNSSERSKEKLKRDESLVPDNLGEKGGNVSLCSVCEKKRKNS